MPFITKDISKAITKKSKLKNNYLKNKTDATQESSKLLRIY